MQFKIPDEIDEQTSPAKSLLLAGSHASDIAGRPVLPLSLVGFRLCSILHSDAEDHRCGASDFPFKSLVCVDLLSFRECVWDVGRASLGSRLAGKQTEPLGGDRPHNRLARVLQRVVDRARNDNLRRAVHDSLPLGLPALGRSPHDHSRDSGSGNDVRLLLAIPDLSSWGR